MKKTIRCLLVAAMTFAAVGCSNLLDITPQSQYSSALVWKDLNLAEAYLNPLYNSIRGLGNTGAVHVAFWDFSSYGDNTYNKFNYGGCWTLYDGAWNTQNYGDQPWNDRYDMIQRLNIFLENIDDVPGDAQLRTQLKGEATFLRAFYYVDLAKAYGDVPLITKSWKLGDDYTAGIGRTPFDSVVTWISGQLDQAATMLPAQADQPASERGRATKGAALATKADILLYAASALHNDSNDQTKWQKAADAAKAVLDLPDYSEYTGDYDDLFTSSGWNSEIIFGREYAPNYNQGNYNILLATNGFGGWTAYEPTQQLVDAYRMANGKDITDPTSGYDPQNPYVGREPRFYKTILYNGAPFNGRDMEFWVSPDYSSGGIDTPLGGVQPWNATETGYSYLKFVDTRHQPLTSYSRSTYHERIWPTYRLSEMYLDYAEAEYHLGDPAAAQQALNVVRTRPEAGLPASTATGTALMDEIRRERRIELVMEAKRYFDLLRWKLADQYLSQDIGRMNVVMNPDSTFTYTEAVVGDQQGGNPRTRTWNDAYYYWPIPYAEMQRTSLTQNPGY